MARDGTGWALARGYTTEEDLPRTERLKGEELLAEEQYMLRTPESEVQLLQLLRGHRLLARDNVIITPHMAWYSRDARERILETTADNITAYAAGHPENVVNRSEEEV